MDGCKLHVENFEEKVPGKVGECIFDTQKMQELPWPYDVFGLLLLAQCRRQLKEIIFWGPIF